MCNPVKSLKFVPKISHLKNEKAGLWSLQSVRFVYITFAGVRGMPGQWMLTFTTYTLTGNLMGRFCVGSPWRSGDQRRTLPLIQGKWGRSPGWDGGIWSRKNTGKTVFFLHPHLCSLVPHSFPKHTLNLPTRFPDPSSSPSPSWPPYPQYRGNTFSQSSKWLNSSSRELL